MNKKYHAGFRIQDLGRLGLTASVLAGRHKCPRSGAVQHSSVTKEVTSDHGHFPFTGSSAIPVIWCNARCLDWT